MTFQQLQYLLAINRNCSVSLAAKELFVSQSSVSIALASLEAELDCRIFIRSTQGLTLTPEGKQVVAHAQRICDGYRLLTNSVKPSENQLRVGSVEFAPARNAFLQILKEYQGQEDVSFSFSGPDDYINRLLRGGVDVIVNLSFSMYDKQTEQNAKKHKLSCQKIASIPAAIALGKGHRLYKKKDLQPEDFANETLLDYTGNPIARSSGLLAYIPINPEKTLQCSNIRLSQDLLNDGYVYIIGHLPSRKAQQERGFRYIPIPGLYYSVYVYTDPIRPQSLELTRYLELLNAQIINNAP